MARNTVDFWNEKATSSLVGRTVTGARYLKKEEMVALGWTKSVLVLTLDDGTLLFPSMDDEGNDGGALFGQGPKNEELVFPVIAEYLLDREPWAPRSPSNSDPNPGSYVSQPSLKKWEDPREKRTLMNLLKRAQRQEKLHYNCEPSLRELQEQGYLSRMSKVRQGRVSYFTVELTEKGRNYGKKTA